MEKTEMISVASITSSSVNEWHLKISLLIVIVIFDWVFVDVLEVIVASCDPYCRDSQQFLRVSNLYPSNFFIA